MPTVSGGTSWRPEECMASPVPPLPTVDTPEKRDVTSSPTKLGVRLVHGILTYVCVTLVRTRCLSNERSSQRSPNNASRRISRPGFCHESSSGPPPRGDPAYSTPPRSPPYPGDTATCVSAWRHNDNDVEATLIPLVTYLAIRLPHLVHAALHSHRASLIQRGNALVSPCLGLIMGSAPDFNQCVGRPTPFFDVKSPTSDKLPKLNLVGLPKPLGMSNHISHISDLGAIPHMHEAHITSDAHSRHSRKTGRGNRLLIIFGL